MIAPLTQGQAPERRRHPMPVQPELYRGKVPCGCDDGWAKRHACGRTFYEEPPLEDVRCPDCGGDGTHDVYAIANGPAWSRDYLRYAGLGGFLVVRVAGGQVDVGHCLTWEQAQAGDFETADPADRVADGRLLGVLGVML